MTITEIRALEVFDSRGKPTLRAFVTLDDNTVHAASVPSGASTGKHEALELRDNDKKRLHGNGVLNAMSNVNTKIKEALTGEEITEPRAIDRKMIELDATDNKSTLGANAILAVSLAVHRAAAYAEHMPLWEYVNKYYFGPSHKVVPAFPRLMVNVVNGGAHAGWNFDIQEFMIMPAAEKPAESVRVAAEIFAQLGKTLKERNLSTLVGDEGGYSPALSSNEEVFDTIEQAAKDLGYERVKDFEFAVDCAASEFYKPSESESKDRKYILQKTNEEMTADELMKYYSELGQRYNIQSFEDPFDEDDWEAFTKFTEMAEQFNFQVVGDDLFVTNPKRIEKGIEKEAANAVLIKLNQIGSVSETVNAIQMTQKAGWNVIVSHRSGETEDSFIADLAYGVGAEFIKTGSMSRSERLAKYNRLIEIENGF